MKHFDEQLKQCQKHHQSSSAPTIPLFQGHLLILNSSYDDSNDSSASLIQRLQKDLCYME